MPICHVKRDVDIYVHVRQTKTYITGEEIRENVNSKTIFCLLSVEKKTTVQYHLKSLKVFAGKWAKTQARELGSNFVLHGHEQRVIS